MATRQRSVLAAATLLLLSALLTPPAASALSYTWTGGGGADTNWSNGANWGGNGPKDNEISVSLDFPALAGPYSSNNDLNGLHVTFLSVATQLAEGDYHFTGNAISIEGPSTFSSPGTGNPNLVWEIPLNLGANVTMAASGRQTRIQGDIDLGARTLTFNAGGDIVLAGVISGTGNIIKNNTSALTISGNDGYTGTTTVNAGLLLLTGHIGGGAVTVKSGATLRGNGSAGGSVDIQAGGTLGPGINGPGTLGVGGLTMAAGAKLNIEINDAAAGTGYDQLVVDSGAVDLGGAMLHVTLGFVPANGQQFTIIVLQAGQGVSGAFDGLPEGGTFTVDGSTIGISYAGGSEVVLTVSPGNVTPTPILDTPTPSPTPTPTGGGACTGDCDGSGDVGINELISGVNIALGNTAVDSCPAFDADHNGSVEIQELIAAVNNALGGCR